MAKAETKKPPRKSGMTSKASSRKSLKARSLRELVSETRPLWVVIAPAGGKPLVHECSTFQMLKDHLEGHLGTDVSVFVFHGKRLGITAGPYHYLVYKGERLPLFELPPPGELDIAEDGDLSEEFDEEEYEVDYGDAEADTIKLADTEDEDEDDEPEEDMLGDEGSDFSDDVEFEVHDPGEPED